MGLCPSCGRYVGPHASCPHCGARIEGRVSMRLIKLTVLVLASVGLAVLWYVATRAEIPTVAIGRADATMNLAYVRLAGRCTRAPSYDPRTGTLSFWIADDSGEIRVASYRAQTGVLIDQQRVPAFGDRVAVVGTLRMAEDFGTLTIDAPDQLAISRADPVDRAIGDIRLEDQYQRVHIRGQVRGVREPYRGLTLVTVRDLTGSIDVAVSQDLIALSGVTPTVGVGQSVEVVAAVSRYRETPQLVPVSAAEILPLDLDVPIASERSIGELARQDVGRWFAVSGVVSGIDPFSNGVKMALDDGTGTITLLLWQDVYDALLDLVGDGLQPRVGARIRAQGALSEYRGDRELIPGLPVDVEVIAPAPSFVSAVSPSPTAPSPPAAPDSTQTPVAADTAGSTPVPTVAPPPSSEDTPAPEATSTPSVLLTPIRSVTVDRVGEQLTLEGAVVAAASFSKGFRFTLDDGTGQVVLLMWHNVYDDCWDGPKINLGATVRVTGEIGEYGGQLEVQPRFGGDVKVIQESVARIPRREIGSISGVDQGQLVMIEGTVVRTEGVSGAAKVFLADDTGEILALVWHNVLDRIADNTGLGTPGSLVRVTGTVQVYRGNLELVPALPGDVAVLEIP
ncbi:MAG: OB-fold nucleic acid binding domain-containing protein [Chloroflexota bacterium]|nr:OB-fold nucleic acid binding domain-containing protein [Chloroflexota bacterium]